MYGLVCLHDDAQQSSKKKIKIGKSEKEYKEGLGKIEIPRQ